MDGTPYISTDFNSVFPGSYASVSQGVHQCGGKRRRKQRKSNRQRKNRNQNKSRKQRKSNKQRRNNKQNKSQDGGTKSLETFRKNFIITQEIIDVNINDENKIILKSEIPIITFNTSNDGNKIILESEVPMITFDNFRKAYNNPRAKDLDAGIREMFNKESIDRKLEMCNRRYEDILKMNATEAT